MENKINIAIDGPAGAGKSTVARLVAKKLNYVYIDTGAMYRALTYMAIVQKVALEDEQQLSRLLNGLVIELTAGAQVNVNGENISEAIRSTEVTNAVSIVASHREIRHEMLARQREMGKNGGAVMDGRDIGTAVLPTAKVKVFLSATVEERARRRYEENVAKGFSTNFEQLKADIAYRDKLDSERETSPLKKAEDAVEIDTTRLSVDEVVSAILAIVEERAK